MKTIKVKDLKVGMIVRNKNSGNSYYMTMMVTEVHPKYKDTPAHVILQRVYLIDCTQFEGRPDTITGAMTIRPHIGIEPCLYMQSSGAEFHLLSF